MKRFQIVLSSAALSDIQGIDVWLTEQEGVDRSDSIVADLLESIERLSHLPNRGTIIPEFEGLVYPLYRQRIRHSYRIIYRVDENRIHVVAVIHQRRDLKSALRSRLLADQMD